MLDAKALPLLYTCRDLADGSKQTTYAVSESLGGETERIFKRTLPSPYIKNCHKINLELRLCLKRAILVQETWRPGGPKPLPGYLTWADGGVPLPGQSLATPAVTPPGEIVSRERWNIGTSWEVGISGEYNKSWGQINDSLRSEIEKARSEGVANEASCEPLERILASWDAWHLNDAQAGCPHTMELAGEPCLLDNWELTTAAWERRNKAQKELAIAAGRIASQYHAGKLDYNAIQWAMSSLLAEKFLGKEEAILLTHQDLIGCLLPRRPEGVEEEDWEAWLDTWFFQNGLLREHWRKSKTEPTYKTQGWVNYKEHPLGLMGGRCTVCGTPYGRAWYLKPLSLSSLRDEILTPFGFADTRYQMLKDLEEAADAQLLTKTSTGGNEDEK